MQQAKNRMNSIGVFSSKAEKYAKYRWTYAPDAIRDILEITGITQETILADMGAGTGILTREFIGKVKRVYAIEPNAEMRAILQRELGEQSACTIIGAQAEATSLMSKSVDVITAAQAVHWFDPEKARAEFHRILKPGGWIVICRNYGSDTKLGKALQEVYPTETNTERLMIGKGKPTSFYYGDRGYVKKAYANRNQLNCERFLGGLLTASDAPDEGSSSYAEFEQKVREIFDEFGNHDRIEINTVTEVYIGQIQPARHR